MGKRGGQKSNYIHNNIQNPQVAWETVPQDLVLTDMGPSCPWSTWVSVLQQFSPCVRVDRDPRNLGSDLIYCRTAENSQHTHTGSWPYHLQSLLLGVCRYKFYTEKAKSMVLCDR